MFGIFYLFTATVYFRISLGHLRLVASRACGPAGLNRSAAECNRLAALGFRHCIFHADANQTLLPIWRRGEDERSVWFRAVDSTEALHGRCSLSTLSLLSLPQSIWQQRAVFVFIEMKMISTHATSLNAFVCVLKESVSTWGQWTGRSPASSGLLVLSGRDYSWQETSGLVLLVCLAHLCWHKWSHDSSGLIKVTVSRVTKITVFLESFLNEQVNMYS